MSHKDRKEPLAAGTPAAPKLDEPSNGPAEANRKPRDAKPELTANRFGSGHGTSSAERKNMVD